MPLSVRPTLLHQASLPLSPAAVQSYEVVMSLAVMSLTLNLTSHGLSKRLKETSQARTRLYADVPPKLCTPAKHFYTQFQVFLYS